MGIYSQTLTDTTEVRLERMRPRQVDAAREKKPALYMPFGAIEWHGRQSPIGLDGIKAHEHLVRFATEAGGVVYPMIPMGTGGGHIGFSHTYMVSKEPLYQITLELLQQFEEAGYTQIIMLSGHYPNRTEFLNRVAVDYVANGGTMQVLALIERNADGIDVGCHGCMLETSIMLHLFPETVDMAEIEDNDLTDFAPIDTQHSWMEEDSQEHPCYGIVGIEPRQNSTANKGAFYTDRLMECLHAWLDGETQLDLANNGWKFSRTTQDKEKIQ